MTSGPRTSGVISGVGDCPGLNAVELVDPQNGLFEAAHATGIGFGDLA